MPINRNIGPTHSIKRRLCHIAKARQAVREVVHEFYVPSWRVVSMKHDVLEQAKLRDRSDIEFKTREKSLYASIIVSSTSLKGTIGHGERDLPDVGEGFEKARPVIGVAVNQYELMLVVEMDLCASISSVLVGRIYTADIPRARTGAC